MKLLLCLLVLLIPFGPAQNNVNPTPQWSRFRGPNGTGQSDAKGIPIEWDGTDALLWKVAVPGRGNSSPIGWGRRIFIQSASDNGQERLLVCLGVEDGKVLWTRSLPGSPKQTHLKNTLATSTPAADEERVYALSWDGEVLMLHAYTHDGGPVWERNLGPFAGQHGAGISPIVFNRKIFLANDQDGSSSLIALDAKSGEKAWQVARPAFDACYSTPFVLERPGAPDILIVASSAGITAYDPGTGKEIWNWIWTFRNKPLRTVASPVYANGLVFANSGEGGGARHTVAVRIPRDGTGDPPQLAWESLKTFPYVPTMLALGNYLCWVNDSGIAGCNVAATGEPVWTERLGGNMVASPVLIDGKIFSVSEDGDVFVFSAPPVFRLLAKNSIAEVVRATPAVVGNRLLIRGSAHLFCFGRR
jgi:outer membrane protein assembly factor BamB